MCGFPAGSVVKSPPAGDAVSTPVWEDPTPEKQLRPWAPTAEPALRSREPQDWARASRSPAPRQGETRQLQKSPHSKEGPARTKLNKYNKAGTTASKFTEAIQRAKQHAGEGEPAHGHQGVAYAWTMGYL